MTDRDEIRGTYDYLAAEYGGARQPDDRELAVLDSFLAGVSTAARDQLRAAGFRISDDWPAPERDAGEPPQPPFFEAVLES